MSEQDAPFRTWDDRHRAAAGLVAEAAGWGRNVDPGDDEALLRWAREYLPRIVAHSDTLVVA